jgi:pseudouridine-5'-phosphate glycosidase
VSDLLDLNAVVAEAIANRKAIVALESTVIAHGLPWPRNIETALALEEEITRQGAVPATIAILDGRLKVGLRGDEIDRIGRAGDGIAKVSRADLAIVAASGGSGATTVAATMIIAALAGIRVFATGGIGGVHRGAETSFDISADLQELARTSVAVVCAGAKSVLDLRLTLEYLETHGVPVIGYRTDRFPAFFSRDSGFPSGARIDEAGDIARVMQAKWALGLTGGIVIANPIAAEFEMRHDAIEPAIEQALDEARAQRVTGKAVTPFLLARVNALTEGNSLRSNVQLLMDNARLAARIAVAYATLAI